MWSKLKNIFAQPAKEPAPKPKKGNNNSSAVSTSSPIVLSLGDIRRRSARFSQMHSTGLSATTTNDPKDPLTTISSLSDDLFAMDAMTYTNLRMVLESKFGKTVHLSREQMDSVKAISADIAKQYKIFSDIVTACVQYRVRESIGMPTSQFRSPVVTPFVHHDSMSAKRPIFEPVSTRASFAAALDNPVRCDTPLGSPASLESSDISATSISTETPTVLLTSTETKERMEPFSYVRTSSTEAVLDFAIAPDMPLSTSAEVLPPIDTMSIDNAAAAEKSPVHAEVSEFAQPGVDLAKPSEVALATQEVETVADKPAELALVLNAQESKESSEKLPPDATPKPASEIQLPPPPLTSPPLSTTETAFDLNKDSPERSETSESKRFVITHEKPTPIVVVKTPEEEKAEKEKFDKYLEFMAPNLEKAMETFKVLVAAIDKMKTTVEKHRQTYIPPAINPNSEFAIVQKLLVRPKYKEMVKGCGSGRTQYGVAWAGTSEPGDSWMNNLLRCYMRERGSKPMEWFELSKKPPPPPKPVTDESNHDQEEQGAFTFFSNPEAEDNSEMRRHADLVSMRAANCNVVDVIDIRDMVSWMNFARQEPDIHSKKTLDIIEDAVEKMGGWNYYDIFIRNWLRHFYLEFGKVNIPFPLPGCRSWTPNTEIPHDGKLDSLPSSISLKDLFQNSVDLPKCKANIKTSGIIEKARTCDSVDSVSEALNGLLLHDDVTHPDVRHWDFVFRSACRELLQVHDVIDDEFMSNANTVKQWMAAVENSGLLTKGRYKDMGIPSDAMNDDSMTSDQKKVMHPDLVWIREKGIVINAYLRVERYARLLKIEENIRSVMASKVGGKNNFSAKFRSSSNATSSASNLARVKRERNEAKKGHKKASSFGILESASRMLYGTKDSIPEVEVSETQSPYPGQSSDALLVATTMNRKPRSLSAPVSAGPEIKENVAIYVEIKELCLELSNRKPLFPIELIEEAFKLSEPVVKYYLREELLAKYQAAY